MLKWRSCPSRKPSKGKVRVNFNENLEGSKVKNKITTNSDMKMAGENSLSLKVINLEKSMGTIVKAVKEIRTSVKLLEEQKGSRS